MKIAHVEASNVVPSLIASQLSETVALVCKKDDGL